MSDHLSKARQILHGVVYEAKKERRRVAKATRELILLSCVVTVLLGIDYKLALIMFTYLDPNLDGTSLGPAVLALSVPVAVVTIHLLIADHDGTKIEDRLQKLAGIGVFVFLFGMAAMVSLVYFDASEGIGAQGSSPISGSIGNQDLELGGRETSPLFSGFGVIMSGVSPVIFFAGMTLILFVTVYASHKLMQKIEERYDVVSGRSRRAKELKALFADAEELAVDIKKREAKLETARTKLPGDPEYAFAQLASATISEALHRMKKALRTLDGSDGLAVLGLQRKADIPAEIETRAEGRDVIAAIRHATTPYAILNELDGLPPKEED